MGVKTFKLFGTTLEVTDDLKTYVLMSHKYSDKKDLCVSGLLDLSSKGTDPDEICKILYKNYFYRDAAEIIKEMKEYGVYNVTTSDIVLDNVFEQHLSQYHQQIMDTISLASDIEQQEIAYAQNYADGMVTGLPFGIISNSLIGLSVYAVQQQSEIKKQRREADATFRRIEAQARNSRKRMIGEGRTRSYNKFIDSCISSITIVYDNMASKHLELLSSCGRYNPQCLAGISQKRSTDLLSNIEIIGQKERIICDAIALCPYNAKVYAMCIYRNLLSDEVLSIIRYLQLESDITAEIATLINTEGFSPSEIVEKYSRYFNAVSNLLHISYRAAVSLYIDDMTDEMSAKYKQFCTCLEGGPNTYYTDTEDLFYDYRQTIDTFTEHTRSVDIFNSYIAEHNLENALQEYIDTKNFKVFVKRCTYADTDITAAVELFGTKTLNAIGEAIGCSGCKSYEEILEQFSQCREKSLDSLIEWREEEQQNEERLKEQKIIFQDRRKRIGRFIKYPAIIIGFIFLLPLILRNDIIMPDIAAKIIISLLVASVASIIVIISKRNSISDKIDAIDKYMSRRYTKYKRHR